MKTECLILVILTVFISSTKAQEFSLGRCPPFPTVKNFEAEKVNKVKICPKILKDFSY